MKDTKTQEVFVKEDCIVNFIPTMLLDIIKNTNGTTAAVESHRNEDVKRQDHFLGLLHEARELRLMKPNEG